MQIQLAQCVNKGMQRDYSMDKASQEFAYENKNIRITTNGENSFLSVTNEKSTEPFLHLKDESYYLYTKSIETNEENNKPLSITFTFDKVMPIKTDFNCTIVSSKGITQLVHPFSIDKGENKYTKIISENDDILNLIWLESSSLKISDRESEIFPEYYILGNCTIGDNLILFAKNKKFSEHSDAILKITNSKEVVEVYKGDLGFDVHYPIECITSYEADDVQKVYWVDGLNQPRVINICESYNSTDTFDFTPLVTEDINVKIIKEYNGVGNFPSGIIQYYITYYKKYGSESNIVYQSPLYYISPSNKGGSVEDSQNCNFKLHIKPNTDRFDYIRVYSFIRTSKNAEPEVSIVADINIKNFEEIQVIDTNNNKIPVTATDILFLNRNILKASTIEQKDNTLFLGNIYTQQRDETILKKFKEELKLLRDAKEDLGLSFKYKGVNITENNNSTYSYIPNLEDSNEITTSFKFRELYRVGLQFQDSSKNWSETVWLQDIINDSHYPHRMHNKIDKDVTIDNGDYLTNLNTKEAVLLLPCLYFNPTSKVKELLDSILKEYTHYRLVIAEPSNADRSIVAQGYINPTVFKLGHRFDNTCYAQPSWSTRPISNNTSKNRHLLNVNNNKYSSNEKYLRYDYDTEIDASTSIYKDDATEKYTTTTTVTSLISKEIKLYLNRYAAANNQCYIIVTIKYKKDDNINDVSIQYWGEHKDSIWKAYLSIRELYNTLTYDTESDGVNMYDELKTGLNKENLNDYGIINSDLIFTESFFDYPQQYADWEYTWQTPKDVFGGKNTYSIELTPGEIELSITPIKDEYFVDAEYFNFYSPELVFTTDYSNLNFRIVGKADLNNTIVDYTLQADTDIATEDTATYINTKRFFNFNNNRYRDNLISLNGGPFYHRSRRISLENDTTIESPTYWINMWAGGDSFVDSKEDPKSTIKKKCFGTFWYSKDTDYYFYWNGKYDNNEDAIEYFPTNNFYVDKPFLNLDLDFNLDYLRAKYTTTNIDDVDYFKGFIYKKLEIEDGFPIVLDEKKYLNTRIFNNNIHDVLYKADRGIFVAKNSSATEGLNSLEKKFFEDPNNIIPSETKNNQIEIKYNSSDSLLLKLKKTSLPNSIPGYNYSNHNLSQIIFNTANSNYRYLWSSNLLLEPLEEIHTLLSGYITTQEGTLEVIVKKKDNTDFLFNYDNNTYRFSSQINEDSSSIIYNAIPTSKEGRNLIYLLDEVNNKGIILRFVKYINDSTFIATIVQEQHKLFKYTILKGNVGSDILDYFFLFYYSDYYKWIGIPYYAYDNDYQGIFNRLNITDITSYLENFSFSNVVYKNVHIYNSNTVYAKVLSVNPFNEVLFMGNEKGYSFLPFINKNSFGTLGFRNFSSIYGSKYKVLENNGINNSIWICELYKDFSEFEPYGGTSENAIEQNVFIPTSQPSKINEPIYGLQGDTYYQRWDSLRTYPYTEEDTQSVVDAVSIMLETHINLDGDSRDARGRSDITNIRPENIQNLNDVYSQSNNYITSTVLDEKYDDTSYPTMYAWSLSKQALADIDIWTKLNLTSADKLDGDKGVLTKLKKWNNTLLAFQERGIAIINFNNQTTISTQDGIPVEIGNSGQVTGHYYMTTTQGCKNKWSIVESPYGIYFIDSYNKSINILNENIKSLSTINLFEDWIRNSEKGVIWTPSKKLNNGFKSFYDPIHKEVYFVNSDTALCFNELLSQFTSFYDYQNMNSMFNINNHIYSIVDSTIYKMFEGKDYCNLYGKQQDFYMIYKINKDPFIDKTWTGIEYRADIFDVYDSREDISSTDYIERPKLINETFDTLDVWNEYQRGTTLLNKNKYPNAKNKFRIWRVDIPRDREEGKPLNRIRNPWIMLKLSKNTSNRMEFHDLLVKYLQ